MGSVNDLVDSISKTTLQTIESHEIFSKRIEKMAQEFHLGWEDIADILGISFQAIHSYFHDTNREKGKIQVKTEREYLKAFSLILAVSPFYLCGMTDDSFNYFVNLPEDTSDKSTGLEMFDPIGYPNLQVKVKEMVDFIITNLYLDGHGKHVKAKYVLPIVIAFCDAKRPMRIWLNTLISSIPNVQASRNHSQFKVLPEKIFALDNFCMMKIEENELKSKIGGELTDEIKDALQKEGERRMKTRDRLYSALMNLSVRSFRSFETLAHFMTVTDNEKISTYSFLKECGFLDKPKAYLRELKWYRVEDSEWFFRVEDASLNIVSDIPGQKRNK